MAEPREPREPKLTKPWRNKSPGDLSVVLEEIQPTPVEPVVEKAHRAFHDWSRRTLDERIRLLTAVKTSIEAHREELARGIALEMGKPIREATGELGAVIAKFDLTFGDARRLIGDEDVGDGPNPAVIRRRPRGVAAVVGPFNFPLHLAHGAILPYLVAGNTVVFKPSPLAAVVAGKYAKLMSELLPDGVFNLVQGAGEEGWALCTNPLVRSVGFTGSVPVGKKLAVALAGDLGKDVALELGGKNAVIVCKDADLELAANAIAEASCLTAGQRCNSTSRVIVDRTVAAELCGLIKKSLGRFLPGDPLKEATLLGPLVSAAAVERYRLAIQQSGCEWLVTGRVLPEVGGKKGHYVAPAAACWTSGSEARRANLFREEAFAPILAIIPSTDLAEAVYLTNDSEFGLTCSVFTRSHETFQTVSGDVQAGNIYMNLPTTGSPSTLPFGGWKNSGNHHPGGRGFIRFATDEQAVQILRNNS